MSEPFIGEIRMFTCNYAPRNWAFCDGSIISIAQNPTLFSIIANFYGGDGRTTMALPDLQGRAPMHAGKGPGLTNRILAQPSGLPEIALYEHNLPSHNHSVTAIKSGGTTTSPGGQYLSKMANNYLYKKGASNPAPMNSESIKTSGQSQPHYNMQPYCVVNFCIALDGIYPPRN